MDKVYFGIDPGKNGGCAILYQDTVKVFKMPVDKDELIDTNELYETLSRYESSNLHVCLESVHSIFGVGAKSNFNFGVNVGMLLGLLKAYKISFSQVPPKTWQKEMWVGVEKQEDNKKTSLSAVTRLYPDVELYATPRSKKAHDGIVDALLIATYAKRKNL